MTTECSNVQKLTPPLLTLWCSGDRVAFASFFRLSKAEMISECLSYEFGSPKPEKYSRDSFCVV